MGKGKRRSKTAAATSVDQSLPRHQKVPSKKVEISGDSDDHSLHTPPPPAPSTSACPIYQQHIKLGFYLKREKVDDCLRQLGDSINGLDDLEKAEICFRKFLFSNLNSCGSGILPSHDDLMLPTTSRTTLDCPFILQVDEFMSIYTPPRDTIPPPRSTIPPPRFAIPPPRVGRMLILSMTDGVRKVYGIETYQRPIPGIQLSSPLGLKVKFSNVSVSGGILSLLPENTIVLGGGGLVDDDSTHTLQASNGFANKDGVPPVSRPYKLPDFPITEGGSKTCGLVVCFGGLQQNVAVGISKLGGSSAFTSKVGADEAGHLLVDILKENNVDTSGMRVDFDSKASTTLAYVLLRADGVRKCSFFSNPSANMLLYESELDRKLIKKAKIFHYGSIGLIYEQCKTSYLAALRFAKTCDCILSYDPKLRLELWPSAEAARKGIMSIWNLADVIKISKDEITHLIDAGDPCDDDDVQKKLFHPTLKLLIVTSGSEGCRYYTNDFKGEVRGLNVEPVDTTGAGDAFVSGILYYIASDPSIFKDEKRLRKALYFASVCGAIMVTKRGVISALPTKDDVLQKEHQLL